MSASINSSSELLAIISFVMAYVLGDSKKENSQKGTSYYLNLPPDIITLLTKMPLIIRILKKIDINIRVQSLPPEEILIKNVEDNERMNEGLKVPVFVCRSETIKMINPVITPSGSSELLINTDRPHKTYYFAGTSEELQNTWLIILKQLQILLRNAYFAALAESGKSQISKIDRATIQSRLTIIKHLYTKPYIELPKMNEILAARQQELSRELTFEEKFSVLTDTGEYINSEYICKNTGSLIIRFNYKAFLTDVKTKDMLNNITSDENSTIDNGLRSMRLNALVHKLAYLILHEVYMQKKYDGQNIVLKKSQIIKHLGYTVDSTTIYDDIKKAIYALYYLDFVRYSTSNNLKKLKHEECGRFITEFSEDTKGYNLCIGTKFIGCLVNTGSKDKENFKSGYFEWSPLVLLPCRDYSMAGYLLVQLLLSEAGNKSLQMEQIKVIAFKTATLISRLKIEYSQYSKAVNHLVEAIEKAKTDGFIVKVEPDISKATRPSSFEDVTLKLYVQRNLEDLINDVRLKSGNS